MSRLLAYERLTLGSENPRITVDGERMPMRYLTVNGMLAYQIAYACGTCGLVLRRQPGAPGRALSAAQVRDRLNAGLDELDPQVVAAFAAQLPRDDYLVMLLDVRPHLVAPGSASDYFATEGPACWRNGEVDSPFEPTNTGYYRLGSRSIGAHDELFEFAVPMIGPAGLDEATTARYAEAAGHPTAVAFGLLDIEGPWFRREQHWGLFHFLLDGHHKTAAAAAAGRPVRLLTFVCTGHSCATSREFRQLPGLLAPGRSAQVMRLRPAYPDDPDQVQTERSVLRDGLTHINDVFINFRNGTFQWIFIKRFLLPAVSCDDQEVLARLLAHELYGDSYAGGEPGADQELHGPYWRHQIMPDSFVPTTAVAETARLRAWARQYADVSRRLRRAMKRELFEPLALADAVYRLRELGESAHHDWGWVLGPFHELVLIDRARTRVSLVVASDD